MANLFLDSEGRADCDAPARAAWLPASWSIAFAVSAMVASTAASAHAQGKATAPAASENAGGNAYPILLQRPDESYADYRPSENAGIPYAWKRVPLSDQGYASGAPYVSFGGELRYRADAFDNPLFGLTNGDNFTSHQTRALLHADWNPNANWRVFVQLGASDESGRKPRERAFDESELDLIQGFAEFRFGNPDDPWRLRAGRQELSFGRYITLRDGTNLRRTFDGFRLTGPLLGGTLDSFNAMVTEQKEAVFDDVSDEQDKAWGASYAHPVGDSSRIIGTYFFRENQRAAYAAGSGIERREAAALRLQARRGALDFDGQFSYQFGTLDRRGDPELDIAAFGFSTESGYTFQRARMTPRIAIRIDGASGDKDIADDKLGTFELAYPDLTYISDATAFAPRNLWGVQPFVTVKPVEQLALTAGVDFLWRMEKGDSVYAPTSLRLTAIDAPGGSYVSAQSYFRAVWKMNQYVEVSSSLVHADATGVLKVAGLADQSLAAIQIATRF